MAANFSRQGAAVATLSIFVVPMSQEFGWSMTEFSGAVSLGGVLGALISPKIGFLVDRGGVGKVLTIGTLLIGGSLLALSMTNTQRNVRVAGSINGSITDNSASMNREIGSDATS